LIKEVIVHKKYAFGSLALVALLMVGCSGDRSMTGPELGATPDVASSGSATLTASSGGGGATTANGWYEGEEIYYIDNGQEEGVTERGQNDIYLIGGNRKYQAQVVEFIPGEPGYSPHWNANMVNTAPGKTLADILASDFVSAHYPEALFDDVEDILDAQAAGLVTVTQLGVVVHCPIIPEKGAEAPGNTELSEDFPRPWPSTF
jgi:hypothetical protein